MKRFSRRSRTTTSEVNVYVDNPPAARNSGSGRLLEFIHLDYLPDTKGHWVFQPTTNRKAQAEGAYAEYSFTVIRQLDHLSNVTRLFVNVYNIELRELLHEVIGDVQGLSWNSLPFQIEPQMLLTFYPDLKRRLAMIPANESLSQRETHLNLLLKYIDTEHHSTLSQIQNLQDYLEVTFELLWYILVPRSLFYFSCPISGKPRVARLISASLKTGAFDQRYWAIELEYTNASGSVTDGSPVFGKSTIGTAINYFKGSKKITALSTYPLKFNPNADQLEERLIERNLKWACLNDRRHVRYDGVAYQYNNYFGAKHIKRE